MNDILKIKKKYKYPLLDKGLSREDLMSGIKVLKTGFITMNKNLKIILKKNLIQSML